MKKSIFVITTLVTGLSLNALAQTQDTTKKSTETQTGTTTKTTTQTTGGTSASSSTTNSGSASSSQNSAAGSASVSSELAFNKLISVAGLDKAAPAEGYTIFAPTNKALAALPSIDTTAAGKAQVTSLVNSHIVKGKLTSKDIAKAISEGKGSATFTTLAGTTITAKINSNKNLEITDANGVTALVTNFNQETPQGVRHLIDAPLVTKK